MVLQACPEFCDRRDDVVPPNLYSLQIFTGADAPGYPRKNRTLLEDQRKAIFILRGADFNQHDRFLLPQESREGKYGFPPARELQGASVQRCQGSGSEPLPVILNPSAFICHSESFPGRTKNLTFLHVVRSFNYKTFCKFRQRYGN